MTLPVYIDTDDYAGAGIELFDFPGGEPHANVPVWPSKTVHVHAKIRKWNDMAKLLVVADALYSQGVEVHLFLPYLPGARQDRNPEGTTPLTSRVYARLLAGVSSTITCVDPHSDIAVEVYRDWVDDLRIIDPILFLRNLIGIGARDIAGDPDVIIAPDEGGKERAEKTAALFGARIIYATKHRSFATGKLSGFMIPPLGEFHGGSRFLIADDICDGGGTFLGILEQVRKQRPNPIFAPVDLYVTHGIFSKGLDVLNGFSNIYTTDSFYRAETRPVGDRTRVRYITLAPYYFGGLRP